MDRPALRRGLSSLQRTAGKRAVGRLLARRGLLDLSRDPNDPLEYDDLESYLAGITVLSEEGARERWEELQRPVASAAARSRRTSSSSPGATTAMSLPDAQMLVGLHGRVGHVTAEHGQQPQHRRIDITMEDLPRTSRASPCARSSTTSPSSSCERTTAGRSRTRSNGRA